MEEITTVPAAAVDYRIPQQTLYSAVHEGRIPARRVGGIWIIRQEDMKEFAQGYTPRGESK